MYGGFNENPTHPNSAEVFIRICPMEMGFYLARMEIL
jgi:hypothetical protein